MAKRSTRRVIIDRLEAGMRFMDQAEDRLAQASAIYYEHGAKEGAYLDQIRELIKQNREILKRFRYETA